MSTRQQVADIFRTTFGTPEIVIHAPGRANIIGEHTDYNQGFVLPFAIAQGVYMYASKNSTNTINALAVDTDERIVFSIKSKDITYGWQKFFVQALQTVEVPKDAGVNLVFGGDLPIGGGISSSSAITCGFIAVLNKLFNIGMDAVEMVQKAVETEVGYGVRGGIMDQFTIVNGKKDKAILLDCKDNSHQFVDLALGNHMFYLINTNVKHNLLDTDYNNRRSECENAVELLSKTYKKISSLRDLTNDDIGKMGHEIDKKLLDRVAFVVGENERVLHVVQALRTGDIAAIGLYLYQSHQGLSTLYDVSCRELDWLVEYTMDDPQVLGARMMGGGFGGCTINLVKGALSHEWVAELSSKYLLKFGIIPTIIPIQSSNGILLNTSYI